MDLSAFFGSIKIFKYSPDSINYSISGGNTQIIRFCIQKYCEISLKSFEIAISNYRDDILFWFFENTKSIYMKEINDIVYYTIYYSNLEAF